MSLDEKEREEYQDYMSNESYHNSMIWSSHQEGWLLGRQKGHDEGLEKGLEKGRYNEKVEVVRNALQTGIPNKMSRPVTLFTGQWADMPLETLAQKVSKWGFDGLELACWGDHFEVDKALSDDGYVQAKRDLL